MEEFKGIGYKNRIPAPVMLAGVVLSSLLAIFTYVSKPKNYILFVVFFSLFTVICLISFIIEKKRPDVVVFLSDNGVKIFKCFKWKFIAFDDIESVDYKVDIFHRAQAMLLDVGKLIMECKNQRFVIENIESVRNCYEQISEALKEFRNSAGKE